MKWVGVVKVRGEVYVVRVVAVRQALEAVQVAKPVGVVPQVVIACVVQVASVLVSPAAGNCQTSGKATRDLWEKVTVGYVVPFAS